MSLDIATSKLFIMTKNLLVAAQVDNVYYSLQRLNAHIKPVTWNIVTLHCTELTL